MNNQQVIELLRNFAFSEEEAAFYLASLSLNRPTISQLAKATNKSRTISYFHVNKLVEKGMLKEIKGNKVARYEPKPPDELAGLFDRFTTDFKSMVPILSALRKTESSKPIIEVSESKKGYYEIYDEISTLPHNSYFMVVEGSEAVRNEMSLLSNDQWHKFFQRIVERNIMTKALFTPGVLEIPSKYLATEPQKLIGDRIWNIHVLPEENFPLKYLFFIYSNKVAILFPKDELVIKIQHAAITELFKVLFNTLYGFAKPIVNPWVKSK